MLETFNKICDLSKKRSKMADKCIDLIWTEPYDADGIKALEQEMDVISTMINKCIETDK